MWQAVYDSLKDDNFVLITVALDANPDDVRPWIEAAQPQHPSLIDTQFHLSDLYGIVNVPMALWIDENGRIVRPNDVVFSTDTFRSFIDLDSEKALDKLKTWVQQNDSGLDEAQVRELQALPTEDMQQARAEFGLGLWLAKQGYVESAELFFVRAGELAPHDFTIRRGSMPSRGQDPFGEQFRQMVSAWRKAGHNYYNPLPD